MAEGQGGNGDKPTEKKAPSNRKYTLYEVRRMEIEGEERDVLLPVAKASGPNPRAAAANVAKARDIEGDFTVIADSARTDVSLAVETKRAVKVS